MDAAGIGGIAAVVVAAVIRALPVKQLAAAPASSSTTTLNFTSASQKTARQDRSYSSTYVGRHAGWAWWCHSWWAPGRGKKRAASAAIVFVGASKQTSM